MNPINDLINKIQAHASKEALIWRGESHSYEQLLHATEKWEAHLLNQGIKPGNVVTLFADYSPNSIAILLALFKLKCIVTPLAPHMHTQLEECLSVTQSQFLISVNAQDWVEIQAKQKKPEHPHFAMLNKEGCPGLVLFSSGSTGKSKAIVHNAFRLLEKHMEPKKQARVIGFLLFDHIGGLNTLFYTLFNGGCFIALEKREPKVVCEAIQNFRANALTTSPTFLTLMLVSGAHNNFDLQSLEVINYGSERMPESTLSQLQTLFPNVRLAQAYGLSEVGVLPIRSTGSDSLWFTLDQKKCPYRIVHGALEIKINSSMLGYLNAESPFTEDGWFKTGDAVEMDGERLKILGRKSEMINVGGEKVYPAEIENVIQTMPEVEEVAVGHVPSVLIGNMIVAKIRLRETIQEEDFKSKLIEFCSTRLPNYKVPKKILFTNQPIYSERFKKMRKLEAV